MIRKIICANLLLAAILSGTLLVYPTVRAIVSIQDSAVSSPGIPKAAWRLLRNLTPRYAAWAHERLTNGRAAQLSLYNISGTEWPLFGSVFYLWAVENLQSAWEAGDHSGGVEPKVLCKDAIIAASDLVADSSQAAWVQKHWGTNYLHEQNVFYRMLVMSALTSRERLLHDGTHLAMLRDQVETFSVELDHSKFGLMNDYPGECYPADVMGAIASIQHADSVLGTDHSAFIARSFRAFNGPRTTELGLPCYDALAETGTPLTCSRGCGNSYISLISPVLWPQQSAEWFRMYEKYFWQERLGFQGFREFPNTMKGMDWTMDVDAGPVVDGFGFAANAFGAGAARKNGRFDIAYPLTAEMIATMWELPNGTLALPRTLSNLSDAPMLGEASILWNLSVQPEKAIPVQTGGHVPLYVYIVTLCPLAFGVFWIVGAIKSFRQACRTPEFFVNYPGIQITLWSVLMISSIGMLWHGQALLSLAFVFAATLLPRIRGSVPSKATEPSIVLQKC